MFELWYFDFSEWRLAGQYHSRKQAVPIAKDYFSRGFRCQIRQDGKVVWQSAYDPAILSK